MLDPTPRRLVAHCGIKVPIQQRGKKHGACGVPGGVSAPRPERRLWPRRGYRPRRRSGRASERLSYGPDPVDIFRRAASYVDRILRGAKPGDLPVQFPTKFEMVVNLKTAKALGLAIPSLIKLRADEVIE
jgi:hypothetical protein